MPKLIIKQDDRLVKKISVHDAVLAFTVGSEQGNDIILQDESVSFFHLQFEKQDQDYFVRDLQSEWGTFVNGRKITSRTPVQDQDDIGVGNHTIVFMHPKNEATAVLDHEPQEGYSVPARIKEKTSGVPSLAKLNSWIHNDEQSVEKSSEFLAGDVSERTFEPGPHPLHDQTSNPTAKANGNNGTGNGHGHQLLEVTDPASLYRRNSILNIETENVLNQSGTRTSDPGLDPPGSGTAEATAVTPNNARELYLLGIHGFYLGRKFKIKHPKTRIGRNKKMNDVVIKKNTSGLTDQSVSRRQATISYENGRYYVTDKRSKSRTFVNQVKLGIDDKIEIVVGDEIEIASDRKNHVLRLVENGDWNFSFPTKAGGWFFRNRSRLLSVYSGLVLLIGLFYLGKALLSKSGDVPHPLTGETTVWYEPGASAGTSAEVAGASVGLAAISDVNGDGWLDLVHPDQHGVLRCIDGRSKELLWEATDFRTIANLPVTIADLNENGKPDVVAVSRDMRLRAVDGNWGIEIWQSPILAGSLTGPPVVDDFNGDGLVDLAVASSENIIYMAIANLKDWQWIKIKAEDPIRSAVTAGALNGVGPSKVLVGTETGKILVVDGLRQRITEEIDINEELSKASGGFFQDQIRHPVALGDLNGDSLNDLVVVTVQDNLIALDGQTLNRLWSDIRRTGSEDNHAWQPSLALDDLDGDERLDIVTRSSDGMLRAFRGSGERRDRSMELWRFGGEREFCESEPVLGDFNNNGSSDVLVATSSGSIMILEGSTGEIELHQSHGLDETIGSPLVGDLDRDNRLDIVSLEPDGKVHKLETNRFIPESAVVWGQKFGNNKHTNHSDFREGNGSLNYAVVGPLVLLNLTIVSLHLGTRRRRKRLGNQEDM